MLHESFWLLRYLKRSLRKKISSWDRDISAWKHYFNSYIEYKKISPYDRQPSLEFLFPCLNDNLGETPIGPIYFYQDAWAFEKIVNLRPDLHVDIGSHHKFVSLLSKVVKVLMVDIRPLSLPLDSIDFRQGSILNLPFQDSTLESVSSLCVVEHIGLGRYGEPIDPFGSEKAMEELKRIILPGGNLYLSLPLDDENRIYFNAHRAFTEEYLFELFHPFEVVESRYIFGRTFGDARKPGFGTGCYHLRCPL